MGKIIDEKDIQQQTKDVNFIVESFAAQNLDEFKDSFTKLVIFTKLKIKEHLLTPVQQQSKIINEKLNDVNKLLENINKLSDKSGEYAKYKPIIMDMSFLLKKALKASKQREINLIAAQNIIQNILNKLAENKFAEVKQLVPDLNGLLSDFNDQKIILLASLEKIQPLQKEIEKHIKMPEPEHKIPSKDDIVFLRKQMD